MSLESRVLRPGFSSKTLDRKLVTRSYPQVRGSKVLERLPFTVSGLIISIFSPVSSGICANLGEIRVASGLVPWQTLDAKEQSFADVNDLSFTLKFPSSPIFFIKN